jgi:hypothetical protein
MNWAHIADVARCFRWYRALLDEPSAAPYPSFQACVCQYAGQISGLVFDPGSADRLQAIPGIFDANVFVFEYCCGTSVSVLVHKLRHLLGTEEETSGWSLLYGTESCSGYCLVFEDLSSCDKPCVNARDRRLAILISDTKKGLPTLLSQTGKC